MSPGTAAAPGTLEDDHARPTDPRRRIARIRARRAGRPIGGRGSAPARLSVRCWRCSWASRSPSRSSSASTPRCTAVKKGGPPSPDGIHDRPAASRSAAALAGTLLAGLGVAAPGPQGLRPARRRRRARGRGVAGGVGAGLRSARRWRARRSSRRSSSCGSVLSVRPHDLGPLARAASAGGWARLLWAALAVALAPPIEELVFRGAFYGGLARSWRPRDRAAVVTTAVFVALHVTELGAYWPAWIAIAALGALALRARVVTGSLCPRSRCTRPTTSASCCWRSRGRDGTARIAGARLSCVTVSRDEGPARRRRDGGPRRRRRLRFNESNEPHGAAPRRRRGRGPSAPPRPTRTARCAIELLHATAQKAGVTPVRGVWGVLMERGYAKGIATVIALADGTASMYLSTGGVGRRAARRTRRRTLAALKLCEQAADSLAETIADARLPLRPRRGAFASTCSRRTACAPPRATSSAHPRRRATTRWRPLLAAGRRRPRRPQGRRRARALHPVDRQAGGGRPTTSFTKSATSPACRTASPSSRA